MTKRYCKQKDYWYDLETGEIEGKPGEFHNRERRATLQIISDIEPYKSPLGTGVVGSRRERREELKRSGCREVDPSEFKAQYKNERFARKHGLPLSEG